VHLSAQVLLLDAETTAIVSTVYSQSEILEREVFLVQRLDIDRGEQLFHLKACPADRHPLLRVVDHQHSERALPITALFIRRLSHRCRRLPYRQSSMHQALPGDSDAQHMMVMRIPDPKALVAMQAVCYLRPTRENIARLRRELRDPRYGEYNLCAHSNTSASSPCHLLS